MSPIPVVNLAGLTSTAWVHDYALNGDEGLYVGKAVEVVDDAGRTRWATAMVRNEEAGYWYFQVHP